MNCVQVYTVKVIHLFRPLAIPLTSIFPRAASDPAHSNGCGLFSKKCLETPADADIRMKNKILYYIAVLFVNIKGTL
jgi:hypothetical protein